MKLFVWTGPYPVSYGSSVVFAIAETVEEARIVAARGKLYSFAEYEQKADMAQYALGEPTRIVDLPCAEWYEWEE